MVNLIVAEYEYENWQELICRIWRLEEGVEVLDMFDLIHV